MKQFLKNNWFKIVIVLIILFVILIFINYQEDKKSQKASQEYKLKYCLAWAKNETEREDCFRIYPQ